MRTYPLDVRDWGHNRHRVDTRYVRYDLFTEAIEQTGNKRTRYSFDLIYDAIRSD